MPSVRATVCAAALLSAACFVVQLSAQVSSISYHQVSKLQACKTASSVFGVTLCSGRIYVLCGYSNILSVYDASTFVPLPPVTLSVLTVSTGQYYGRDIVCASNTLYVSEFNAGQTDKHKIWGAALPDTNTWTLWTERVSRLDTMWVNSEGRVLVLSLDESRLLTFNQDASVASSIALSTDKFPLRTLRHAVQLAPDRYVVSNGIGNQYAYLRVVDPTGTVLATYGGATGADVQHFRDVNQLALDGLGRLYVADMANDRVVALEKDLSAGRVLLEKGKDGIDYPFSVSYDLASSQLMIGQAAGVLLIFKID